MLDRSSPIRTFKIVLVRLVLLAHHKELIRDSEAMAGILRLVYNDLVQVKNGGSGEAADGRVFSTADMVRERLLLVLYVIYIAYKDGSEYVVEVFRNILLISVNHQEGGNVVYDTMIDIFRKDMILIDREFMLYFFSGVSHSAGLIKIEDRFINQHFYQIYHSLFEKYLLLDRIGDSKQKGSLGGAEGTKLYLCLCIRRKVDRKHVEIYYKKLVEVYFTSQSLVDRERMSAGFTSLDRDMKSCIEEFQSSGHKSAEEVAISNKSYIILHALRYTHGDYHVPVSNKSAVLHNNSSMNSNKLIRVLLVDR